MTQTRNIYLVTVLFTIGLQAFAAPQKSAVRDNIVNVFAAQNWASLGATEVDSVSADDDADRALAPPLPLPPALPVPAPAAPFELVGQWQERTTHAVILSRGGRVFVACSSSCGIRGAVVVDQEITDGYRLKKLNKKKLVVVARDGALHELELLNQVP